MQNTLNRSTAFRLFRRDVLYTLSLMILLFSSPSVLNAQEKYTISGKVQDKETGETLLGATVSINGGKTGTITNEYGVYSITLPKDSVKIVFSYIGLQARGFSFYLDSDKTLNVELSIDEDQEAVIINANSNQARVNSTQMGVDELSAKEIKEIPVMFGEADLLKILQLKPGVQSGGEGTSGLFVRGGSADQNLFLLDEAPVYNPNHLFGLFSTFNADAVNNVKLYKAGFPAEYGGKLSAVVDVRMREGNRKKYAFAGGIGVISSRFLAEGPIKKDKASFLVSGRRTYVDLITNIINKANENKKGWSPIPAYNFYDFNLKINADVSEKDRIFFSAYYGRDFFTYKDKNIQFNFNWGNAAGTFRWNRMLTPKIFMNNSLTFSDYVYVIKNQFDDFAVELGSGIRDINLKSEYHWSPNNRHQVKFGANAIYHFFKVNRFDAGNGADIQFEAGTNFHTGEFAGFIADDWKISEKFSLNYGLRLSGFYNDTFQYGIEPRMALKYSLHKNVSLKASYTRMYQYIHMVASSGASLPTDVWYPSNARVKPQFSDMVSIGTAWALSDDLFISAEGYYKWLYRQVDFRDGAQLFVNDNLDQEFVFGTGDNYGFELYVEKKHGWWHGWVGYTLSWSWRNFPDVMDGSRFPSSSDRRHDISVVSAFDIPKTPLTFSLTWVYGTGKAFSLPEQRIIITDISGSNPLNFYPVYTRRNGSRLPAYHRMDFAMVWKISQKKRFKHDLTLSVYNVYNRYNAFFVYIEPVYPPGTEDQPGIRIPEKFQGRVVSLFPVLPSLTWNFSF